MRTKFLPFIVLGFLIAYSVVIVPGTTFARGFSHESSIGPIGGGGSGPAGESRGGMANNGNPEGQPPSGQSAGQAVGGAGNLASKVSQYGCYGVSCDNQDPAAMGCNKSRMTFAPFSVIDASGDVLATGQNVYSVGCNANWTEGTLAGAGRNIIILASTTDSQSHAISNCFPHDLGGVPGYNCTLAGYNGATGWPAFSDMVDGTNLTKSVIQVTGPDGRQYLNSITQ